MGGNNLSTNVSGTISGAGGSLVKVGTGTLTLSGANTYTGGTTILGGTISVSNDANLGGASGGLTLTGGTGTLQTTDSFASARPVTLGFAGGIIDTMANTLTLSGPIGGTGTLNKIGSGTLNLTGNNTYTGGTQVLAGTLSVSSSLASFVFVNNGATLGGSGTIVGNVVNAGMVSPGNSIGTLTINGNYAQSAGSTYQVEVNSSGQGDRVNISGIATLLIRRHGQCRRPAPGSYAPRTTYTILNAAGGRDPAPHSGVTSNFAFLNHQVLRTTPTMYS